MVTGQPVESLVGLDERMLVTLQHAHEEVWSRTDQLIALVVDSVGMAGYNALIGPHADPRSLRSARPPQPLERPGVVRQKRRRATVAEMIAGLGYDEPLPEELN